MKYILMILLLIASPAWAGYKVTGNLEVTGNAGIGSANPRAKLDVDGAIYGTAFHGDGSKLTGITTTDSNAGTLCAGANVYLNGEGQCITIDNTVYASVGSLAGYVPTTRTVNGKALSSNIVLSVQGDIDAGIYALDTDLTVYALASSLASYVPTTRTVNGKALSSNVTLTVQDVDASIYALDTDLALYVSGVTPNKGLAKTGTSYGTLGLIETCGANQVLKYVGTTWTCSDDNTAAAGATSAGGAPQQIQYNTGGVLGGIDGFLYDGTMVSYNKEFELSRTYTGSDSSDIRNLDVTLNTTGTPSGNMAGAYSAVSNLSSGTVGGDLSGVETSVIQGGSTIDNLYGLKVNTQWSSGTHPITTRMVGVYINTATGSQDLSKIYTIYADDDIKTYHKGNIGVNTTVPFAKVQVDGALYVGTTIPSWSAVNLATSGDAKFSGDVEIDGALYVDGFLYGNGSKLTGIAAGMTYPSGSGVAVVSSSTSWGTTLSTDGSGDCASGSVCLGDHTHSGYQAGDAGLTSLAGLSFSSGGHIKQTALDTYAIDNTVYQPQDNGLSSVAGLSFTSLGYVKATAADTFAIDTTIYQPQDAGLTNLATLAFSSAGMVRQTASDTFTVDTTVYAPYSTFTGLTSGRFPRATGTGLVDGAIYQNATGYVGVAATAPVVQMQVDGSVYVGTATAPTWTDAISITGSDLFVKGDIETDGSLYTDASGDTLLNYSGGNVLIGTTVARNDLTIDGSIYVVNLTTSATRNKAMMLCWGLDGVIYGISSGSCY